MNTIFAKKVGMTQKYDSKGERVGATVLSVPNMVVAGLKTKEKNGYTAVEVNVGKIKREIRTDEIINAGTEMKFEEIIKPGDKVNITGISKGHGFTGVVKRHGFKGGPRTHGQSDRERAPGSSGQTTTPGRVMRGKRMAGRMGNDKIMVRKLKVLEVDAEKKLMVIKGSVAGSKATLLIVEKV